MRLLKFRSWNEIDNCFYYFQDGKYFDKNNKEIDEWCFDWANAEQFTGNHDKNGKEIYEGDIVKLEVLSEPVRHKGTYWIKSNFKVHYDGQSFYPGRLSQSEVIGNVHENPELLETVK